MTIPDKIENDNKDFFSKIQGSETVGIDKEGRLFEVIEGSAKTSEVATPLIGKKGVTPEDEQHIQYLARDYLVEELTQKKYHQIDQGREAYLHLVDKFGKANLLSEQQRSGLAFAFYNQRFRDFLQSGMPKWIAEAKITLEMAYDNNIPDIPFKRVIQPVPVASGLSGSYFLKDRNGRKIAIFKPQYQEAGMPDNAKRYAQSYNPNRPLRNQCNGHNQGESWKNEAVAKNLDNQGFIGVPQTVKLEAVFPRKWKRVEDTFFADTETIALQSGSLQEYVGTGQPVANQNLKKEDIPVYEVQKIVLFDLLCGNADRNLGNALYDPSSKKLTPIDHGLILFDNLDWEKYKKDDLLMGSRFCSENFSQFWDWPQCEQPLDDKLKKWISDYDIEAMAKKLKEAGKSDGSIREFRIHALFLKEGIARGLNLKELASFSTQSKHRSQDPTKLDQVVTNAVETEELEGFEYTFKQVLQAELIKHKVKAA